MKTLLTISELSAQTALALSKLEFGQASARVSDAPSSRTIRYYCTHGLVDKPASFKGRTALYTERHLLQLVAIKSLQSKGRALSDIQDALLGASDSTLKKISGISDEETNAPPVKSADAPKRGSFWKDKRRVSVEKTSPFPVVLPAIKLAEGLTLILETSDLLDSDLESIRAAAEPLVALLQQRRIIRPKKRGSYDD